MAPQYTPHPSMPYPSGGGNSLEDRVTRLEMHSWYAEKDRESLEAQIGALEEELAEVERDRAALLRRLTMYGVGILLSVIGALLGTLWNLAFNVSNGGFLGHG